MFYHCFKTCQQINGDQRFLSANVGVLCGLLVAQTDIITCILHVTASPASSTWCPQIALHPIISPDEMATSARCHPTMPQWGPLYLFILASLGMRPWDDPGLRPSGDPRLRPSGDRLSDSDELSSSADPMLRRARLGFALRPRLRRKHGVSACPALICSALFNKFEACN